MELKNKLEFTKKMIDERGKMSTFYAMLDPKELRENDLMTILFVSQNGNPYACELPGGVESAVNFLRELGFEPEK